MSKVFEGLTFCISGKSENYTRKELEDLIKKHGGATASSVTKKVTHLITTAGELEEGTTKITKAKENNVFIVSEEFLHASIKANELKNERYYLLTDAKKKAAEEEEEEEAEEKEEESDKKVGDKRTRTTRVDTAKAEPETKKSRATRKATRGSKDEEEDEEEEDEDSGDQYFSGLCFCISGALSLGTRKEIEAMINGAGGVLASSLSRKVTHFITSEAESGTAKVGKAMDYGIPMLSEKFLSDCFEQKKLLDYKKYVLKGSVDSDEEEEEEEEENPAKKAAPKKSTTKAAKKTEEDSSTKQRIIKKGRAVVDPYSGKQHSGHVYEEGDVVYNATLNQTNIAQNNNKFYIIQIIQDDNNKNKFTVWNRWGRVGAKGQTSSTACNSAEVAKRAFEKKFKDKTGNNWEDRHNFVHKTGKYVLVETDYNQDDEEDEEKKAAEKEKRKINIPDSKLDKRLQDLVSLISDVKVMTQTLEAFDIDVKQMPLGKLSKNQIKSGFDALKDIQEELNKPNPSKSELSALSSVFYSRIPHAFGMRVPPPIDTKAKLQAKIEMLETLSDMEIASTLLKQSDNEIKEHPIDATYATLKTDLIPLDHDSDEFQMIKAYVDNTHAPTHTSYKLEILDVFAVRRHGEAERFEPFKKLHNRRLLWHGSRLTNFMGILSQGLRIAPPEAPATGYMFGKGVYFADMVTKSANYCFTNQQNNIGCMLLSEVALGNMYERLAAEYVTKLPPGMHSTWGKGKTQPNPEEDKVLEDGVIVPLGKPVAAPVPANASLYYNEFIVYDVAQVNIKYLLKVKFNYKY